MQCTGVHVRKGTGYCFAVRHYRSSTGCGMPSLIASERTYHRKISMTRSQGCCNNYSSIKYDVIWGYRGTYPNTANTAGLGYRVPRTVYPGTEIGREILRWRKDFSRIGFRASRGEGAACRLMKAPKRRAFFAGFAAG